MKHNEMYTWTLRYCKETFGTNHKALADEVTLFKEHWKTLSLMQIEWVK